MSSYLGFSGRSALHQLHQHVLVHQVVEFDKYKASLTVKWLSRVASLDNIGPVRSVILSEVVNRGQMCLHLRQEKTPEETALQYVRYLTTFTSSRLNSYTCPHSQIAMPSRLL